MIFEFGHGQRIISVIIQTLAHCRAVMNVEENKKVIGLISTLILAMPTLGVIPTNDVETPFTCIRGLRSFSTQRTERWSHGVYDTKCEFESPKTEDEFFSDLSKGFAPYLKLARTGRGNVRWRVHLDHVLHEFNFHPEVITSQKVENGITKLDVRSASRLSLTMSVPLTGVTPRRWWKGAICSDNGEIPFLLDPTIKAIACERSVEDSTPLYIAVVDKNYTDLYYELLPLLSKAGYHAVSFVKPPLNKKRYIVYNAKRSHGFIIVKEALSAFGSPLKNRSLIEWPVPNQPIELR